MATLSSDSPLSSRWNLGQIGAPVDEYPNCARCGEALHKGKIINRNAAYEPEPLPDHVYVTIQCGVDGCGWKSLRQMPEQMVPRWGKNLSSED